MRAVVEAKIQRMLFKCQSVHAFTQANLAHHLNSTLFEHPGAKTGAHMILLRAFNDDRLDALQVQKVRKHQARGARANDANLCPYHGQFSRVIILMPVVIDVWPYR
jgi:hypothetical protein